jgi:hypothetical protein
VGPWPKPQANMPHQACSSRLLLALAAMCLPDRALTLVGRAPTLSALSCPYVAGAGLFCLRPLSRLSVPRKQRGCSSAPAALHMMTGVSGSEDFGEDEAMPVVRRSPASPDASAKKVPFPRRKCSCVAWSRSVCVIAKRWYSGT